jgi:hypothetical protein
MSPSPAVSCLLPSSPLSFLLLLLLPAAALSRVSPFGPQREKAVLDCWIGGFPRPCYCMLFTVRHHISWVMCVTPCFPRSCAHAPYRLRLRLSRIPFHAVLIVSHADGSAAAPQNAVHTRCRCASAWALTSSGSDSSCHFCHRSGSESRSSHPLYGPCCPRPSAADAPSMSRSCRKW